MDEKRYDFLFSVEEVNRLTLEGMPFRDAYKKVGLEIESENFSPNKNITHTHEGSIGNLCNEQIVNYKNEVLSGFNFTKVIKSEQNLLR